MIKIFLSAELGKQRKTMSWLHKKTGIRRETLYEWYHDLNDRISLEQLEKICTALECQVSDLIAYDPDYICPTVRSEKAERWRKRHTSAK